MSVEAVQASQNQQAHLIQVSGVYMGAHGQASLTRHSGTGNAWPGVTVEWSLGEGEDIMGYGKG